MNTYKKYCPNVFVAQSPENFEKGDTITLTTKYRKENEHIVHNLIGKKDDMFLYSITRKDGFNSQERAKNKVDLLNQRASSAKQRSQEWQNKSTEGKDFLALAEPIKVAHHSERRHRALIERNWNRMGKAVEEMNKAESYEARTDYWKSMENKIDLSMPESIEFFHAQLEEATQYHKAIKDGTIERKHSYTLTYANKKVKELKKKYDTALLLWQ